MPPTPEGHNQLAVVKDLPDAPSSLVTDYICADVVSGNDAEFHRKLGLLLAAVRLWEADNATRVAELEAERDAALNRCTEWATKAGHAQEVLEASELAGMVREWKQRAETAEAEVAALKQLAETAVGTWHKMNANAMRIGNDGFDSTQVEPDWNAFVAAMIQLKSNAENKEPNT